MTTQTIPSKKLGQSSIEAKKYPNATDEVGAVVLKCSNEIDSFTRKDFIRTKHTNYRSSMRIPQNQNFRKRKKCWKRFSKLNSGHKLATLEFFKQNPNYDQLSEFQKAFVEIFWTRRYCNHSMSEISEDLGWNKTEVFTLFRLLEEQGLTKPQKKFKEVKGEATKIQKRTHKPLTKKGQKLLNSIVNFSYKGAPIAKAHNPGIVVVDGIPKLERNLSPKYKKKLGIVKEKDETGKVNEFVDSESGKEIFENTNIYKFFGTQNRLLLLRTSNKKNMPGQPAACGKSSFEKEVWSVWHPALFDSGALSTQTLAKNQFVSIAKARELLETPEFKRRKALKQEYDRFKTCARRRLFEMFGLVRHYDENMHIGIWRAMEKEPVEKIAKALKHMKKKHQKGYRFKNFVGFFTHLMKHPEKLGYHDFKAEIYRDAIDGKTTPETSRLLSGQDPSEFVALAKEMETKTGEILPIKTLNRMIRSGDAQVWLKALQAVKFRHQLDEARKPKTRTENIYEKRKKTETWTTEEAVRDERGVLQRDEDGKILWERVEKTEETGFYEEVLVGTREMPIEDHGKSPKEKVKSWVGLWVYAVKMGSVEKINDKFFAKKAEEEKKMPKLPGSPPKEDFEYELVDDEYESEAMPLLPSCGEFA